MSEEEEDSKGFRVTDKRKTKRAAADADAASQADGATAEEARVLGDNAGVHVGTSDAPKHPPIDFGNFALSLAHSALVAMGIVEHPEFGQIERDLDSARQSIEILEMLEEKTRGNLDEDEEKLLSSVLYELRVSFVSATAQKVEPGS